MKYCYGGLFVLASKEKDRAARALARAARMAARWWAVWQRWWPHSLSGRFLEFYGRSRPANLAAALAFRALASLFPLSLLILALLGLVGPHLLNRVAALDILTGIFPLISRGEILRGLESLQVHMRLLGLLGLGGLLWGGSAFFNSLEGTFNVIYRAPDRLIWHSLLLDLVLTTLFTTLILLAGVAGTLGIYLTALLRELAVATYLRRLPGLAVPLTGVVAALLLFAVIYRWVPNRRLTWRQTWLGTLVGAFLWQGLGWAFGTYLKYLKFHRFGGFGLFLVLLIWFYALGEIIILGAILNAFLLGRGGPKGTLDPDGAAL